MEKTQKFEFAEGKLSEEAKQAMLDDLANVVAQIITALAEDRLKAFIVNVMTEIHSAEGGLTLKSTGGLYGDIADIEQSLEETWSMYRKAKANSDSAQGGL